MAQFENPNPNSGSDQAGETSVESAGQSLLGDVDMSDYSQPDSSVTTSSLLPPVELFDSLDQLPAMLAPSETLKELHDANEQDSSNDEQPSNNDEQASHDDELPDSPPEPGEEEPPSDTSEIPLVNKDGKPIKSSTTASPQEDSEAWQSIVEETAADVEESTDVEVSPQMQEFVTNVGNALIEGGPNAVKNVQEAMNGFTWEEGMNHGETLNMLKEVSASLSEELKMDVNFDLANQEIGKPVVNGVDLQDRNTDGSFYEFEIGQEDTVSASGYNGGREPQTLDAEEYSPAVAQMFRDRLHQLPSRRRAN